MCLGNTFFVGFHNRWTSAPLVTLQALLRLLDELPRERVIQVASWVVDVFLKAQRCVLASTIMLVQKGGVGPVFLGFFETLMWEILYKSVFIACSFGNDMPSQGKPEAVKHDLGKFLSHNSWVKFPSMEIWGYHGVSINDRNLLCSRGTCSCYFPGQLAGWVDFRSRRPKEVPQVTLVKIGDSELSKIKDMIQYHLKLGFKIYFKVSWGQNCDINSGPSSIGYIPITSLFLTKNQFKEGLSSRHLSQDVFWSPYGVPLFDWHLYLSSWSCWTRPVPGNIYGAGAQLPSRDSDERLTSSHQRPSLGFVWEAKNS